MENNSLEEWKEYDTISYLAAIYMLLDGNELNFYEYDDIEYPSIMVDNESWQVIKVKATGEYGEWGVDWETIKLEMKLENGHNAKEVALSSETIAQKDALELLRAIYEIMDNGEYEDLWQFLGYEVS
jgi:hypothetical protein